jgi:hypothetical protein
VPLRTCSHRPRLTTGVKVSSKRRTAPASPGCRLHVAQGEVELGVVEIGDRVVRGDADVDLRMEALEALDARQQPERAEGSEGGDADPLPAARAPDLLDAGVELVQQRLDRTQQDEPVGRDLHVPGAAHEQLGAELVLEPLDLPAHRRLGDVQLVGRGVEAERAGDRLECPEVASERGRLER